MIVGARVRAKKGGSSSSEAGLTSWPTPAIPTRLDFAGPLLLCKEKNRDQPGGRAMSGKRIAQWVVVLAAVGLTGCCRWCERHCCQPSTCCQPAAPMYAPQPAAYQAPACCPGTGSAGSLSAAGSVAAAGRHNAAAPASPISKARTISRLLRLWLAQDRAATPWRRRDDSSGRDSSPRTPWPRRQPATWSAS